MKPIPADFRQALQRSGLDEFFREHPRVHRVDYLRWITTSKRWDTRRRRIDEAVARLTRQWQEELAQLRRSGEPAAVVPEPRSAPRCE